MDDDEVRAMVAGVADEALATFNEWQPEPLADPFHFDLPEHTAPWWLGPACVAAWLLSFGITAAVTGGSALVKRLRG